MRMYPFFRTVASFLPSWSTLVTRVALDRARRAGRPHDPDFEAFRGSSFSAPPCVVDVGANRGQSIESFRSVLGAHDLVAFEPNPQLVALLRRVYGRSVTVHGVCLADVSGRFALYVPTYGRTVWDTRASLDESDARGAFSPEEFWCFRPSRVSVRVVEVAAKILDDYDLAPSILKIDVEGAEDRVVAGAKRCIARHRPIILTEGRLLESEPFLRTLGYQPHRYDVSRSAFVEGEYGERNTFYLCPAHLTILSRSHERPTC